MLLVPSAKVLWRGPEAARVTTPSGRGYSHSAVIPCWRGTYGDEATAPPRLALDSAIPHVAEPAPPYTTEPPWTVLLWDPRPSRLQGVSRIIAACGARLRYNEEVAALPQVEGSYAWALAVVALGTRPAPGDLDLEAIRSLKRKGLRVICYEDGHRLLAPQLALPALIGWFFLVT